jgi:hypothetical protein
MRGANVAIPEIRSGTSVGPGNQFEVSDIQPGTYTLRVSMPNYRTQKIRNLSLKPNQLVIVDFVLDTLFVDMHEII